MPTSFLIKYKQTIIATCFYLVFGGSMAAYTGYIPSGFHFQEDHEIIDGMKEIKKSGFLNTAYSQTTGELSIRFRPIYNIYRYIGFYLFRLHFSSWHLLIALFLLGFSILSFLIGRILGLSFLPAVLFPLLMSTGSVTTALVRLGTIEFLGMLLTMAAIYFTLKSVTTASHIRLFEILSHCFALLACCTKEAFIPLVPVFIAVKLFSDYSFNKISLKATIKQNWLFIITEMLILSFCFLIMKLYMKKLGPIYGGFDGDLRNAYLLLSSTILSSLNYKGLTEGTGIYFLYIIIGFLIILILKKFFRNMPALKILYFYTSIFIYLSATQYLIHYKVQLSEYYLLPFLLGPAIVICLLADLISKNLNKIAAILCYSFIFLLLAIKIDQSYEKIKTYTNEGIINKKLIDLVTNTQNKTVRLLICGDELIHMEHFIALSQYFDYFSSGRVQTKFLTLPADEKLFMQLSGTKDSTLLPKYKAMVHCIYKKNLQEESAPIQDYDDILVLSNCEKQFFKIYNADSILPFYTQTNFGQEWYKYALYRKASKNLNR